MQVARRFTGVKRQKKEESGPVHNSRTEPQGYFRRYRLCSRISSRLHAAQPEEHHLMAVRQTVPERGTGGMPDNPLLRFAAPRASFGHVLTPSNYCRPSIFFDLLYQSTCICTNRCHHRHNYMFFPSYVYLSRINYTVSAKETFVSIHIWSVV